MTETHLPPRLGEPAEDAVRRLRALLDINVALGAIGDVRRLLDAILRTTTDVLRCEAASILLFEPRENVLRFVAATGDPAGALKAIRVPLHDSLAGTIYRENRPLLAVDLDLDERHFAEPSAATGLVPHTLLGVPMRIDGQPIGVLEAINPREAFDAVDAEMLLIVSSQAAVALQRARQAEALERTQRRLADLDRVKSDFMAVASHELRTPLAVLCGFGEILREEVPPELVEHAQELVTAARGMESIVETLEEMSQLDAGRTPIVSEPLSLHDVIETAWLGIERPVTVALPEQPVHVVGERRRLSLAFRHLVENADRFTPPDGEVRIEAEADGTEAHIRVKDTGCGIEPQDLERIFEAFTQAEAPLRRTTEGLGMGLTVARSVVLRHQGRLWAESAGRGRGATFHVRLPLAA